MPARRDILPVLALAIWGTAGALLADVPMDRWLVLVTGVPVVVAMLWRRSAPRVVALALLAVWVVHLLVAMAPNWGITPEFLPPLAVFGIAAYHQPRTAAVWQAAAVACVFFATTVVHALVNPLPYANGLGLYVYPLALLITGVVAGVALRDRSADVDAARARLRAERRAASSARSEAARARLEEQIRSQLTRSLAAIDRHLAAARTLGAPGTAVAASMSAVQDAASDAMRRLRETLTAVREDRPDTLAGGDAVELEELLELEGVRVTIEGELPRSARGIAVLARAVGRAGVALLQAHARGPAALAAEASDDGVVLRFSGRGWWWLRAQGSPELERLLDTARVGGVVKPPRPWRPWLEVRFGHEEVRAGAPAGRLWRLALGMPLAAAAAPVVLLVALGLVEVLTEPLPISDGERVLGALLSPLPFLFRRRWPVLVVAAVAALVLGRQLLGDLGTPTISQNFLSYFAMFVVGAYARSAPAAVLGWVVVLAGSGAAIAHEQVDYPPDAYVFWTAMHLGSAATGVAVRRRMAQAAELEILRERSAAARRAAVAAERMELARELHDALGHSITVIAVQAGAAAVLAERDPGAARDATESVLAHQRAARAELARLLSALRSRGAPAAPRERDDLADLVERSRRSGLPVTVAGEGALDDAPPALAGAAYRIVQEALTNVVRHAGAVPTTVTLVATGAAVRVDVVNAAPRAVHRAPGSGSGLAGMRDRALGLGGAFEAGPTPDGGFAVRALLPLEAAHESARLVAVAG
jgi:signal transduction histidine kinase